MSKSLERIAREEMNELVDAGKADQAGMLTAHYQNRWYELNTTGTEYRLKDPHRNTTGYRRPGGLPLKNGGQGNGTR